MKSKIPGLSKRSLERAGSKSGQKKGFFSLEESQAQAIYR